MVIVAVVFAVLGAASNAAGTAFQRKAASAVPRGGGLRLIAALAKRPAWLAGIAGVVGAALFQALALTFGPLALVQPLFILELPFALLIAAPLLHRQLPAAGWYGVAAVVFGLALALGCAAPAGNTSQSSMDRWIPALAVCWGLIAAAVVMARRSGSPLVRATALGAAAAIGNALTAALLKSATGTFSDHGPAAFLTTWQTYGFALTGIVAVLLLENALQAGSLAASQPALTIGDAIISLLLGITLFAETIRTGWFVIPELVGVAVITAGVLALTRAVPHIRDLSDRPLPVDGRRPATAPESRHGGPVSGRPTLSASGGEVDGFHERNPDDGCSGEVPQCRVVKGCLSWSVSPFRRPRASR